MTGPEPRVPNALLRWSQSVDDVAHISTIGQRAFARINTRAIVSLRDGSILRGLICPNGAFYDPKGSRFAASLIVQDEDGDREIDFLDIKNVV